MSYNDDFWEDEGPRSRYQNAYGDYRGGYGPVPNRMGPPEPLFMPPPGPPPPLMMRALGPGPMRPPPAGFRRGEPPAIRYLMRCGLTKDSLKGLPRDLLNLIQPEYCGLCGHNFDTFQLSRTHYISKNHAKTQKKWLAQNGAMGPQIPQEAPLKSRELYCELCDVEITSKVHAESHYAGKSHHSIVEGRKNPKNPVLLQPGMQRRLQQLIRREKRSLGNKPPGELKAIEAKEVKPPVPELYCDICKTSVTCSEQMTAHMNGKRHLTKEKQHILKKMRGEIDDNEVKEEAIDIADNGDTADTAVAGAVEDFYEY